MYGPCICKCVWAQVFVRPCILGPHPMCPLMCFACLFALRSLVSCFSIMAWFGPTDRPRWRRPAGSLIPMVSRCAIHSFGALWWRSVGLLVIWLLGIRYGARAIGPRLRHRSLTCVRVAGYSCILPANRCMHRPSLACSPSTLSSRVYAGCRRFVVTIPGYIEHRF